MCDTVRLVWKTVDKGLDLIKFTIENQQCIAAFGGYNLRRREIFCPEIRDERMLGMNNSWQLQVWVSALEKKTAPGSFKLPVFVYKPSSDPLCYYQRAQIIVV